MSPSLLWLGATIGTTFIVTRSSLFAPVRALFPKKKGQAPFFATLLRCPKCFGTWTGAAWSLVFALMEGQVIHVSDATYVTPSVLYLAIAALAYGTTGAASCWLADLVFRRLGGDKVLAHERHPWQDVSADLRSEVTAVLQRHAASHAENAERARAGMSEEMSDVLAKESEERAAAYTTALDVLGP